MGDNCAARGYLVGYGTGLGLALRYSWLQLEAFSQLMPIFTEVPISFSKPFPMLLNRDSPANVGLGIFLHLWDKRS
ncbi:MAG: hypothetical protein N2170_04985 [Bacteroidia bacterium]|nr:hypothetical protein [Bacteroidia bacterium]